MPGGRPTHKYPHGKPIPLVLVDVTAAIVGVAWLALFSWGWRYRILIALAFLALVDVPLKAQSMMLSAKELANGCLGYRGYFEVP